MPRVGFEPKIPLFKREKTVHALDRAAAVIGLSMRFPNKNHTSIFHLTHACHMSCPVQHANMRNVVNIPTLPDEKYEVRSSSLADFPYFEKIRVGL
jgi:hypothetical protein